MNGIRQIGKGLEVEFLLLPRRRKTQRDNLALLVATPAGRAQCNLMDLAAGLPLAL